jgi:hypothetical protein
MKYRKVVHVLLLSRVLGMRPRIKKTARRTWRDLSYSLRGYSNNKELRMEKPIGGPLERRGPSLGMLKSIIQFLRQAIEIRSSLNETSPLSCVNHRDRLFAFCCGHPICEPWSSPLRPLPYFSDLLRTETLNRRDYRDTG